MQEALLGKLMEALAHPTIRILAAWILADVALGIGAAVKERRFEWRRLADFVPSMVFPMLLGYIGLRCAVALASGLPEGQQFEYFAAVVWGGMQIAVTASIVSHIKVLTGRDVEQPPVSDG